MTYQREVKILIMVIKMLLVLDLMVDNEKTIYLDIFVSLCVSLPTSNCTQFVLSSIMKSHYSLTTSVHSLSKSYFFEQL